MCIRKIDWKDRPFQNKLQMIANCLRVINRLWTKHLLQKLIMLYFFIKLGTTSWSIFIMLQSIVNVLLLTECCLQCHTTMPLKRLVCAKIFLLSTFLCIVCSEVIHEREWKYKWVSLFVVRWWKIWRNCSGSICWWWDWKTTDISI